MRIFGDFSLGLSRYRVNKGIVKVVRQEGEDFRVKYSDELDGNIQITTTDEEVVVNVTRDIPGAEVHINVAHLDRCSVALESGNMYIDRICNISQFSVLSGNLFAKVTKDVTGMITAKVGVGILKHTTDLNVIPDAHPAAFMGIPGCGMQQSVSLMGTLGEEYHSSFDVGSGVLDMSSHL